MAKENLMDIARWATDYTVKKGADQASVTIRKNKKIHVKYREGRIEELKDSVSRSLSLNIYSNHRFSSHNTSDLSRDSLRKFIEDGIAGTRFLSQDKYRSILDKKYYPAQMNKALDIYDPAYHSVEPRQRAEIASELEAIALKQSDRLISVISYYDDSLLKLYQVNSNGFEGEDRGTYFTTGCTVTARDGEKGRPQGWYYVTCRHKNDLPANEEVSRKAVKQALDRIGQSKIDSGAYPMVVENRVSGRVLSMLHGPMTARALQQKNSFLDAKKGEKIASGKLTMIDHPFLKKGLGTRRFGGEGFGLKKRTLIQDGVLKLYLIDNYYGKKLGVEPNSGSLTNVLLKTGTNSLDDLTGSMKRGILVTGFLGGNSNSTTGDFSLGIIGHLVENGKITRPVNEMNVSGNQKELWNRLVEVGNDPWPYSSWRTPSIMFESADFSGI
jgi:PmbA protein